MSLAKGKYGWFDERAREYVITRPDTPQPWYNYLINDLGYCALVSHTGGGMSFFRSARERKLLRYRYNGVPADRPGRWLYLRDMAGGDFWSATWAPVMKPLDKFRFSCRVGLNRQVIESRYDNIESRLTYFVLPDRPAEVWLVRLVNRGDRPRVLHSYSYGEFNFWGTLRDLLNLDNCAKCSRYGLREGIIAHWSWNDVGSGLDSMRWVRGWAGFRSGREPVAVNLERTRFLGGVWRGEDRPLVVESGEDTNFTGPADYPITGLTHRWELAPGEERELAFMLAYGDSEEELRGHLSIAEDLPRLKQSLAEVGARWEERLQKFQVRVPACPELEPCVNTWNQYQSHVTARLSRSVSPYEWGAGRGLGFRDTLQDLMAVCHSEPSFVRERLLLMASLIHRDGIALHNYFPDTDTGGDGRDFYDDHLWLPLSAGQYLRETGDFSILDEPVPFRDAPGERQRLFERLLACLDTTWRLRGEHGLPQTGHADWNDGLNPGSMKSESVFNAMLFCAAAREMAELAEFLGNAELAAALRLRYQEMKETVNRVAWDGAWYRRILLEGGGWIGGKGEGPGAIFLEPQVWAVLSGVAEGARALTVMDSVARHLATPHGVKLLDPPYQDYNPAHGSISIYLPGHKENGAVFCHAAAWAVVAEALLGRGEQALDYYLRMAPVSYSLRAELHETEPYVYSQHIAQAPFHQPGRARNSWLTGSAAWFTLAAGQYLLGVRPTLAGLALAPAIPYSWKGFSISRTFRGARYEITVSNPEERSHGVRQVRVDGRRIEGHLLPVAPPGTVCRVEAEM